MMFRGMNLIKMITHVLFVQMVYVNYILAHVVGRDCINFSRVIEMDNKIIQNVTLISKNNIGECSKSCVEMRSCLSFMFNVKSLQCAFLTESTIRINTTRQEDGWIFFSALRNLAYMKKVFLSTTVFAPENAVDGYDENIPFYRCAAAAPELQPYWYVDLGTEYDIKHVEIFLFGDCCWEDFHDVDVTVARSDKEFDIPCNTFKGPATNESQPVVLNCHKGTYGRYVKLQIMKGKDNLLLLCEVKVLGK